MQIQNLSPRSQEIEEEIIELQRQINLLPDGKLICVKNGKYDKWYHRRENYLAYIAKADRNLAEQLAVKEYLSCRIRDLKTEQSALNSYLDHFNPQNSHTNQLLSKPAYQKLLTGYFEPLSQELYAWSKEPYECNRKYPENLIHKSVSGNILRSKSEAMIDMLLYQAKIPYRYECEIKLNGTAVYPDFTIRHPKNGKVYYWEHFGMMDVPLYAQNCLKKMQIYLENGIIPNLDLITTFETRDRPLTPQQVQEQINRYFF